MIFTYCANYAPSTHHERREMDLSLALDTMGWCRRNRLLRAAEWLRGCVVRIREELEHG